MNNNKWTPLVILLLWVLAAGLVYGIGQAFSDDPEVCNFFALVILLAGIWFTIGMK